MCMYAIRFCAGRSFGNNCGTVFRLYRDPFWRSVLDVTGLVLAPFTRSVHLHVLQIVDPYMVLVVVVYCYETSLLMEPCLVLLISLLARVEAQLLLSPLSAVPDRFVYLVLLSSRVSVLRKCRNSNYRLFHLGDARVC